MVESMRITFLFLLLFLSAITAWGGQNSCSKSGTCLAPGAISSLTATQGTQTGKVTLTWTADPYATGYEVWRADTVSGKAMKIATLTAPASGADDSTVSGASSYFYTVKTIIAPLTGAASNQAEGWANVAPTSASVALTASSTSPSAAISPIVVDPNVTVGKTESYTFAITAQPDTGTLTGVGNKFVYTPPADGLYSGLLAFEFSATDKGGAVITGTGSINVTCASPTIRAFTLPATGVLQATPISSSGVFSLPACSTNSQVKVEVIDSAGVLVSAGVDEVAPNGSDITKNFTSHGLAKTGNYRVRLTVSSDFGIDTKTAALTVNTVNLPTLTIAPGLSVTAGEETVTATLSNPAVVNCPFTSEVTVAMADASNCYVVFTTAPDGMTLDNSGALPSLSGTLENAGRFPITAEVYRFDGAALLKIDEVSQTLTSSCVAPSISTLAMPSSLLSYEVPNYGATYKASACNGPLSGTLTLTHGAAVVETLNLLDLDFGAAVTMNKAGTGLPEGNYTATLNISGSSGADSKSQSFSIKTAPMPTLIVSPTLVSMGESKVDARLQPSADNACPLTTDITLAQADPERCYVDLTTTVPDLLAGFDTNGLPTLSGYPATPGDYTVQAVVSRWVNGARYDSEPLTKTVKVNALNSSLFGFTGKTRVYEDIERVRLVFKQFSGTLCDLYADQATAQTEAVKGKRTCFVNFAGTTGLSPALTLNQFKMEGTLSGVGIHTLSYTVLRAFSDGTVAEVESGDFPIAVINKQPPQITLKGGYKIPNGHYYVQVGQAITHVKIAAGFPTDAKIKIAISSGQKSIERNNVMSDSSYWILAPPLELLKTSSVSLRVAWQDYQDVYSEQMITVVGGTENNMKLVIDAPRQIADTGSITVKVRVGKYTKTGLTYNPETMGQWRTQIMAETDNQKVKSPITELKAMVNGEATFQINPAGNLLMKLTAVSELVSSIDGLVSLLSSSTQAVEVAKGSPIEGTITAKTLDGPAPKNFTLNLEMTKDNRVALKEVTWQESDDGGVTWTSIEKSKAMRHNINLQTAGKRQARAKMVNKNTLAESYTEPVEVWAYSLLEAQITGPSHMAPGYTATLASELYRDGRLTTDTVNEWTIQAPSGTTVTNGATATLTEAQEGKVYITLKTRPAETRNDDPNAWSYARYYLSVKTPAKPSVSASGPRDVEIGKTYHYEGAVRVSWGGMISVNATQSEWQLPDGSTMAGTALDWVPNTQDLIDKKPLIFRAWVAGFKDTTTSEMTISYVPWQYIWPEFTMSMKQLTVQAPSDLLLMVNYNQPSMSRRFEGLTYSWSFPTHMTGRQNDAFPNRAAAQALFAGEYDVTVTIQDTRGHRTVLTQPIVAEQATPYTVTLKVGKSNLFERVPMTVTVRSTIYGGHPLDAVISQAWKIDGVPIDEYVNRNYLVSDINDTGDHVISYTLNSKMGVATTVNSPLSLISNQIPVCKLKATPNAYVVYAEAKCTDLDGKVIGYAWQVNGQPIGATSYRISFGKTGTPQSASVTLTAMDDALELSMPVAITVTY